MKSLLTAAASTALMAMAGGVASAQCAEIEAGGASVRVLEGYNVAELAAEPGLMPAPELSEGAIGVLCDRDTIVPDANDFELVRFHRVPLYIRDGEGDDATVLALYFQPQSENEDGTINPPQYGAELPQGTLTDEDRAGIVAAIEGFAEGEQALDAYILAQREAEEG
ncbi:hypothetical protein NHF40_11305 [Maricaulaceae bacterium EIL42A08]|nr:hypothetical protein [Maricaulaceae bacterium EIL42A08]